MNQASLSTMNASSSPSRKGRPALSDEQRAKMRAKITASAEQLFQSEGYGKVSMRRIASEIGCSPMSLYKYFDAKIDILQTLWASVFEDLFDQLDTLDLKGMDARQQLLALSSAYVDYWLRHRDRYRLVFMADGVEQPDVTLFLDAPEIVARYQIFAEPIMRSAQGPMSEEDLKLRLDTLVCSMHGIAHNHVTISGYAWAAPDQILELTIEGLLGRQSDAGAYG